MVHLIVQLSKYIMIILFLIYTFLCFHLFKYPDKPKKQKHIYNLQRFYMFLIHLDGFLVLFVTTMDTKIIGFYIAQLVLFESIYLIYHKFYKNASELVLNNMVMMLCISMIILTRISFDKALRQFVFVLAGTIFAFLIPLIMQKGTMFRKLTWTYAGVGILGLLSVLVVGVASRGAKLSLTFGPVSIQPSEFVKILFVFFIASMLYKSTDLKQLAITSGVSAVFVLILVASNDLGGALLYFFTYLVMIYVATKKFYIFAGGLAFVGIGMYAGYHLFSHVKNRIVAWLDPLSVIDKAGYQVCQSLFAIGTGGLFGFGLGQGLPNKIPIVSKDFIIAAISEEMGGIFAVCLIMVCVSCFLMIFNLSMQMKDVFYKYVALGLGSVYALQVLLTVGGSTKFIPMTGVTLPLVSYGGSSLLSTMIIFGMIQGMYIMQASPEKRRKIDDKRRKDHETKTDKSRQLKSRGRREVNREGENRQQAAKTARRHRNREYAVVTYFFLIVFVGLIGYFLYFQFVKSDEFINSPYNSLQDLFSKNVVRGEIQTKDGHVIARTNVSSDASETREYPDGRLFAHVAGFAVNGKAGLEKQENFSLLRSHEFFLDQIVNDISGKKNTGDNVITTLDYEAQAAAYNALDDYEGAVIAIEPKTGKIAVMVSKPDYDPNTIASDWESVNGEGSTSLYNRATQGQYAPGSVFKIFTALEYYNENPSTYNDYSFDCDGSITKDGFTIHCAGNKSHGQEDLTKSFAKSCNSSFSNIGLLVDNNKLNTLCDDMLFNKNLPIAFDSKKSKFALDNNASSALTMQTTIGQGNTLVSPLHMCMIAGAICNDGNLMRPYLVDHTENASGALVEQNKPASYKQIMSKDQAAFLQNLMAAVVSDGTGAKLSNQSYEAFGKTGTAQVSDSTDQTNAWFVGYGKKDGYNDLAIAVIVEDSGAGSTYAVPVAKKVFDKYFNE